MVGADVMVYSPPRSAAEAAATESDGPVVIDHYVDERARLVKDKHDETQRREVGVDVSRGRYVRFTRPLAFQPVCGPGVSVEDVSVPLSGRVTVVATVLDAAGNTVMAFREAFWFGIPVDLRSGRVLADGSWEGKAMARARGADPGAFLWNFEPPRGFITPFPMQSKEVRAQLTPENLAKMGVQDPSGYRRYVSYRTLEADAHIRAYVVRPQTPLLHHVNVFVTRREDGAAAEKSEAVLAAMPVFSGGELLVSWNRGMPGLSLPRDAGLFLERGTWRFVFEYHYGETIDWQAAINDPDFSEVEFFLTTRLRPHNASILVAGFNPRGQYGKQGIYGRRSRVDMAVDIPGQCLPVPPGEAARIVSNQFHMHRHGTAAYLEHVRPGSQALPLQGYVPVWSWQSHGVTPATSSEPVLPEDTLRLHCIYDLDRTPSGVVGRTRGRPSIAQGTDLWSEMCLNFAVAYPATERVTVVSDGHCQPGGTLPAHGKKLGSDKASPFRVLVDAECEDAEAHLLSQALGTDCHGGAAAGRSGLRAGKAG
mmetsp:Transcript_3842/g.10612  ORF Transcript_3842/g.10612 Transcript_3842/m.10612 type:complete len:537 (+) Transcript_3842:140-1750(+)